MKRNFQKIGAFFAASFLLFLPLISLADLAPGPDSNLIVCNTTLVNGQFTDPCTFEKLVKLGINFMNFLIILAVPLAVISFVFAGFKLVTSAGSESNKTEAKKILTNTGLGLVIVLAAWLIVKTILISLLKEDYSLLTF